MRERSTIVAENFTAPAEWNAWFVYDYDDFPLSTLSGDIQNEILADLRNGKTYGYTKSRDWDLDINIHVVEEPIFMDYKNLSSNQQEMIIDGLLQDRTCGRTEIIVAGRYKVTTDLDALTISNGIIAGKLIARQQDNGPYYIDELTGIFTYDFLNDQLSVHSDEWKFFERNIEQLKPFILSYVTPEIRALKSKLTPF